MLDKPRQLGAVSEVGGRGKKGGLKQAARDLGVPEQTIRRSVKIASLSPEAMAVGATVRILLPFHISHVQLFLGERPHGLLQCIFGDCPTFRRPMFIRSSEATYKVKWNDNSYTCDLYYFLCCARNC